MSTVPAIPAHDYNYCVSFLPYQNITYLKDAQCLRHWPHCSAVLFQEGHLSRLQSENKEQSCINTIMLRYHNLDMCQAENELCSR